MMGEHGWEEGEEDHPVQKRARPPAGVPLVDEFDWQLIGQELGSRFTTRATVLWRDDEADGLEANVVVVFCDAVKVDSRAPETFPPLSQAGIFLQALLL